MNRRIALTIDDVPVAMPGDDADKGDMSIVSEINDRILSALRVRGVPTTGFINGVKIEVEKEREQRMAVLANWIKVGFEVGNHTFSHDSFSNVTLNEFEEDVLRCQRVIEELDPSAPRYRTWFRHPRLDLGGSIDVQKDFMTFLERHDFMVAPVTIHNSDYQFNDVLSANDRGQQEICIEEYLDHTLKNVIYAEAASWHVFGLEVPQVLLLHCNQLNALALGRLLMRLEDRGYEFESLATAVVHSAYSPTNNPTPSLRNKYLPWEHLLAGLSIGTPEPPQPPRWIEHRSDALRKQASARLK